MSISQRLRVIAGTVNFASSSQLREALNSHADHIEGLIGAAESAYSEIAWAVQDIAARRLDNPEQCEYRSSRLAECADRLRAALDSLPTGDSQS